MKKTLVLLGVTTGLGCTGANAANLSVYANAVSAHNIAMMQHTIARNVMEISGAVTNIPDNVAAKPQPKDQSPDKPYGSMLYYGEYGDDTGITAITGRNGGDSSEMYIGIDWQHFSEDLKFKSQSNMESYSDMAMISLGMTQNNQDILDAKFFGGYFGGHSSNSDVKLEQGGGFVGVRVGKTFDDFQIGTVMNFGVMTNTAKMAAGEDSFNNIWAGVGIGAMYDFTLNPGTVLRPGVYGGYAWIHSPDYASQTGVSIENKNFGMFELSPSVELIQYIANGWSVNANATYVMNFGTSGETYMNDIELPDLDINDYLEYGIKLGKQIEDFTFVANIGRHDGGRSGWTGGIKIKCVF